MPWDKVDIRVLTIEVTRAKLNDVLTDNHVDLYPELVTFLDSKGFKEVHTVYHTNELISQDSVFVRKDLEFALDD